MRREFITAVPDREVVRVLVVDDHVLFAEALMLTLAGSRVVIVTAAGLRDIAAQALVAGAECCLTKDTPALKLIDAVLDIPRRAAVTQLVPREARIA